jgi:hypothetical protein
MPGRGSVNGIGGLGEMLAKKPIPDDEYDHDRAVT